MINAMTAGMLLVILGLLLIAIQPNEAYYVVSMGNRPRHLIACILAWAEEREKPELLAESRDRRIRVAEESGKSEQEVQL
jgi:signal recognition particle GTPase